MSRWAAPLLALLLAVVASASGFGLAHAHFEAPVANALARALGLPASAVSVSRARLIGPAALQLVGLRAGPLTVRALEVTVDPWSIVDALFAGRLSACRIHAVGLRLDGRGRADSLDATLARRRSRLALHGVRAPLGPFSARIAELGLELDGHHLERAAFTGGAWGPVVGLTGTAASAAGGAYRLRLAREGLEAQGKARADEASLHVELDRFALAPFKKEGGRLGLELADAAASGTVDLSFHHGLRASGHLALSELTVANPTVSSRSIDHLAPTLEGELAWDGTSLTTDRLRVALGSLAVVLQGRLANFGPRHEGPFTFDVGAALEPAGCQALLQSLPRAVAPVLDGMLLTGMLGGQAHLAGDLDHLDALTLGVDLDVGCRVRAEPPLADISALMGPLVTHVSDAKGASVPFELSPKNPSWRPLATLPARLVRTFLISEDGRFFLHHGFELDRIRHALAADLGLGRVDRGASTITQQLAKNLFLPSERTLARKLEEAVLTWRIEQVLPKRRILELYLNLVELGPGIHGVAEGAERYFGKEPEELSVDEAAQLAALLPAPRRGMDAAWQKRYRALLARLPREQVARPPTTLGEKLTRR